MALSGSVSTNGYEGRYYTLAWTATQSIENNTTTLSWTLSASGGSSSWYTERTLYVNINGKQVFKKTAAFDRYTGTIKTGQITIAHNQDGTKSFSVSLGAAVYYSTVNCEGSKAFTLDTIARASSLSVADGTLDTPMNLTASRKSSGFTHTLTWKCGSYSGTIASKSTATSWSFKPDLKLAEGAPNGTKVYCWFSLTTYNGTSAVGSVTKNVWLTIPETVKPTCTLSLSDSKGYLAKYGKYVQGRSVLHVSVTGTGARGSKILSYSTSANGSTYTSKTFDTTLKTVGSNTITTTVKDSRGRTASASKPVEVIAYAAPKINSLSVRRCNEDGGTNDLGSHAKISYSYSITSLNNKNTNTASLKYKKTSATKWTTVAISPTSYDMSGSKIIAADEASSYDVRIEVTDAFTTSSTQIPLSTGFCLYHIPASGKGITFGGIAEGNGFSVQMPATFTQYIDARERIYMGGVKKTDDEKQIYFQSTENGDNVHSACIYGGNASSKVAIGMYDSKNSRSVMQYTDGNNKVSFAPQTHFDGGLTEDILTLASGDCNALITSGQYYIGSSGANKPGTQNGWLTVKALGVGNYCFQEYITYLGARYRRMRDNGTWGSWIQEADFVVSQGTSSTSSGTWTFRKWNGGLAECWIRWTISKPYSLPGICSYTIYFPFSFSSTEYIVQALPSKNGKQLKWYGPFNSTGGPVREAGQMMFSIYYNNSTAYPIVFDIYVTGRWK